MQFGNRVLAAVGQRVYTGYLFPLQWGHGSIRDTYSRCSGDRVHDKDLGESTPRHRRARLCHAQWRLAGPHGGLDFRDCGRSPGQRYFSLGDARFVALRGRPWVEAHSGE